jgi:hypothetical protein
VLAHDPATLIDVFKFRRFRLNLISFLRLPLGVSESDLRDVIKGCSISLYAGYVARAERAVMKTSARSGGIPQNLRQPSPEKPGGARKSCDTDDRERHKIAHQNVESRAF